MKPADDRILLPTIYVSESQYAENFGQCDCDCGACVEQIRSNSFTFVGNPDGECAFLHTPLMVSDKLVTTSVSDHLSVFDLTYGNLLVLNAIGEALLQSFEYPATISDVVCQYPEVSASAAQAFCAALIDLAVLQPVTAQAPIIGATPRSDTLIAWLHLNNQCNLQCRYCYVEKSAQAMSEATAKCALEEIVRIAVSSGYKRIKLKYAGGEPTLTPDLLMQTHLLATALAEIHHLELEANILSNGVILPSRLIDFSLRHGLKWAISLDGLGDSHNAQRPLLNGTGSSQKVLASIEALQAHGISPAVPITLTRYNLKELPTLVDFLLHKQLRFSLNFYRQNGCGGDTLYPTNEDLIDALSETYAVVEANLPAYSLLSLLLDRMNFRGPHLYPCAAGHDYLAIGHQGNAAPCQMLVSQPHQTPTETVLTCRQLQSETFQNLAAIAKAKCSTCSWQRFCAGGCPMEAFHAYGRFDVPSPYCEVYRALASQVLRLESLRVLKYQRPLNLHPLDDNKHVIH
jgi:uncharacterized protein